MSAFSIKRHDKSYKNVDHRNYLTRITKTLYYGKLPKTDRLSLPVTELAAELFSEAHQGKSLERLHLNAAANISREACIAPCSLILAMLYLERLKIKNPEYLEKTSPSDLFLVSLMVSSKYLFDDGESDEVYVDEWAASGGISVPELVQLEREFLKAIEWEIYIKELMFWKKLNEIETELAQRQGNQRGFFTYTEMANLATIIELNALIQCVFTMTMILVASYTAAVLTISGSFQLVSQMPGNALQYRKIDTFIELTEINSDNLTNHEMILKTNGKNIEPLHVLKTSLFLASLNTFMAPYCNKSYTETNEVEKDSTTWKWWKIPSMVWLTEISMETKTIENYVNMEYYYKYFMDYLELLVIGSNYLHIGNHFYMNKATKTRIQDQMESTWHKEWTDSLKKGFIYSPYVPNIKI